MKGSAVPTKLLDGGLVRTHSTFVGIDQSLTGFALTAISAVDNTYITWVYKSPYFGIERLMDIRQWLYEHLDYLEEEGGEILDVAMEGSVLQSYAALKLGELAAIVKLTIREFFDEEDSCKIYPLQVPPMTLKKYASGKGNAKKQEMLLQIYKRWGVEFNDDNAADSYALARLCKKSAITEIEKAVVEQMKDDKYRDQPRF